MRDSEIVSNGTSTVLEDTETAEYTHTLTVTGRLGGYYQCIVSNNKPSMASSSLLIQGEAHLKVCACNLMTVSMIPMSC